MNKPVFENVIGEKIDISNALVDTLGGGAVETVVKDRQAQEQVAFDGNRAPVLDVTQDPNEGRRSIQAFQADETHADVKAQAPVPSETSPSDTPALNGETAPVEASSDEIQLTDNSSAAENTSISDTAAFGFAQDPAPRGDEGEVSSLSASFASITEPVMTAGGGGGTGGEPEEQPPTDIRYSGPTTFAENLYKTGDKLGELSASDASGIKDYAISGSAAIGLRKVGTIWELYVKDASLLNYEAYPGTHTFDVNVTATDVWGNASAPQLITFTLTDVAEVPTNLTLSGAPINENPQLGASVGTLSGISNEGGPLFWEFTGNAGSALRIVNNGTSSAYLEVVDPTAFDYESLSNGQYKFDMRARSMEGQNWASAQFTVVVNNVQEDPSNIRLLNMPNGLSISTVSENVQPGQRFAYISVVDDAADKPNLEYTITGQGAEYFEIELDFFTREPWLKLKDGIDIDAATLQHISLTVSVRDPNTNVTVSKGFGLFVSNDNEAPTITVAEGKEGTTASTIGDVVKPFTGVTLADPDDLDVPSVPNTQTLKISFAQIRGDLTNAEAATRVEVINGDKIYTFQGTASQLQTILRDIGFDPANNAPGTTSFTLSLTDVFGLNVTNTQVHVDALANHAPTLSIDAGDELVYLSDDEAAAPAFGNIWLGDEDNNDLTLTVSFLDANGVLSGTDGGVDRGLSPDGLTRTFEFHGKAADLQQLLAQLKWNQTDGVLGNTRFTLTLSDGITTVTNDARQVVIDQAPTIRIAHGTEITPAVDNGPAVKPFRGIDLADRENDTLIVTIYFEDAHGVLAGATGATTTVVDGRRVYEFTGKANDIEAILRQVTFDPHNGVANTTQFTIRVDDGRHAPVLSEQIQVVTSTAAGSANAAPTIYVDPELDTIPATDTGPAVSPFLGVTLQDAEDDILTVTVSFNRYLGTLVGASGGVIWNDDITYTFRGTAADIQDILHGLLFNPSDGEANETTFTITVKDDIHQAVSNNQIKVVTEVAGGPGSNQPPVLNVIDDFETIPATDTGSPVTPFMGIEIRDAEDDDLEITVSFLNSHGTLGNLDTSSGFYAGTVLDGDLRTYSFHGKALALQNFLRGLTFNPTDGVANTTNFSITIKDTLHQAVENHDINVETSVSGGGGSNIAPLVSVIPGWETTDAQDNGPAVYPFLGVRISDQENDWLTVTVSFQDNSGVLGNADLGTSTLVNGIRTYTFTGRPGDVEALLHHLTFNPTNDSAVGGPVSTGFTITVKDDLHQAVGNNQIHVETSHGTGSTNNAPVIFVPGTGETPATDTGASVSPFTNVTLSDSDGDVLTLTVSFRQTDGDLINTGAATGMSVSGDTITYTFSGTAGVLQTILRGLSFDPENGVANTTIFTLGLQDPYHAPVTNSRVKVVTSLATPPSNDPPMISVAATEKIWNISDIQNVTPFHGVDLFDRENNDLTVTVSFLDVRGALTIAAGTGVAVTDNGVGLGGIRSFTLTGKADDIDQVLKAANFDPADGISNSTNFTISVKDDYHQAVTNQDIVVNSTAVGAPSAPTWSNNQTTISIDENSTVLPFRIQATDPNEDPIHFVLVPTQGSQNGLFVLDPDGQIRLAPRARLDYESGPTLNIYVRAIDSNGMEGPVQKLTIRLNDIDEAPNAPLVEDGYISENTTGSVTVATDSEDPEQWGVTYEWADGVSDTLKALFNLDQETGEISVVSALNHESPDLLTDGTNRYYELKVVARDGTDMQVSAPTLFRVNVLDENEALTDAVFSVVSSISENAPADTVVANLLRVDDPDLPGPNENFRFSLVQSDGTAYSGPFRIDPANGQIKVSGTLPDVSAPTSVTLHVKVADHGGVGGYSIVRPVTFTINPANPNNTAPTIDAPTATFTIADDENVNLVKPFAGVTIFDPDATDTITVTVTMIGQFGGKFIDADGVEHLEQTYSFSGTLQDVLNKLHNLKFNPTDRPGAPNGIDSTTFHIEVQDGQGGSVSITPNIRVDSVHGNNAPPDVSANGPIEWTTPDNIAVPAFQHLVFTDPDTNPETGLVTVEIWYDSGNGVLDNIIAGDHDPFSGHYSITGTLLQVNEAVAALRFQPFNRPNGTDPVTTDFLVRITDGGNARDEITVTVHATSNDSPTDVRLGGGVTDTVAESLGVGQVVGTLTATDESPSTLTYTFVSGFDGAGHFVIDNTTKQIKVANALNFEDAITTTQGAGLEQDATGKFYRLKVMASDGVNQSAPQEIKVYVTDVNEAPDVATGNATVAIAETAVNGDVLATFTVADADANEQFVYELSGVPAAMAGAFAVDTVNKRIVVADSSKLAVTQNETFTLTLTVKDKNGGAGFLTDTQDFTVTILNGPGDRPPVVTPQEINDVPEDTGVGFPIGAPLSASDPDGDAITGFSLVDPNVPFEIRQSGSEWFLVVAGPLDYETAPHHDNVTGRSWYEVQVTATAGGQASAPQTIRVYISDVEPDNTAPVITLAPNGRLNWTVDDDAVVDPFQHLSFSDLEDGGNDDDPNTWIEAQIYFEIGQGDFENLPDMANFPGAILTYEPGGSQVIVRGTADQVTAIVRGLHFHTRPRPDEPDDASEITHFYVFLFDTMGASAIRELTVDSRAGDAHYNMAPTDVRLDGGVTDTVAESLGVGQVVGTLTATDESPTALTYSFVSGFDGAGHFVIDNATKQIKVANALNFEDAIASGLEEDANGNRFYRLKVMASDGENQSSPQEILVYITNVNEAPTLAVMTGGVIDETLAEGEEVGELFATDPDAGDSVSFRFGNGTFISDDGAFEIVGNKIILRNPQAIQVTNPDGEDRDYEIVAYDQQGATSTTAVTIHINDVPPVNAAPTLSIAPGTETTNATDNGMAVYPFRGVDLSDAENDSLTLTISFAAAAGVLGGTTVTGVLSPDGQTIAYTFTGTANTIDAILHGLSFNPNNGSAAGGPVDTPFTISVTDNQTGHAPVLGQVVVHTTSGDDSGNLAPILMIAPGTETTAATSDGPAVYPFRGVDIADADNDQLTLTISFEANEGQLSGAGLPTTSTVTNGIRTYVLTGSADQLDAILRGLAFDPANGTANTTPFTISVQDSTHAPVTRQVTVETSTGGAGTTNEPPMIAIADHSTDATDNGPAVRPFLTVDLSDAEEDILTLTISFTDSHGVLGNTNGNLGTVSGGVRTFVFTGNADALDVLLSGLTFDPAPDLAAAGQVTTTFTIAVQDSTHAAVTDTVNVVTHHGGDPDGGSGNDPLDITLTPNFVDENLADRVVGTLAAIDPDLGDTFTYKIVLADGTEADTDGRFAIASDGISLKTVGGLDWESSDPLLKTDFFGKYYEVTVRATDSTNRSLTKTLKVYVTDTADDPSNAAPVIGGADTDLSVPTEDNGVVLPFGNVTFSDTDSDTITVTIALDSANEGFFEGYSIGSYNELTGVYTVSGLIADVQNAVRNLQFHAVDRPEDPDGTPVTTNFSITVSDGNSSVRNTHISVVSTAVGDSGGGNEAPTAPTLSQSYVFEFDTEGTLIGNLESTDGNGDPIEYWIMDDQGQLVKDDGRFKIVNNELQVSNPLMLDAEANPFHDIILVATDNNGGVSEVANHQISVLDWIGEAVTGDDGDNLILAFLGNDNLSGGIGNDTLSAGIGRDVLTGGDGADVFIFDTDAAANNTDTIVDFKVSDGDKIHLKWDIFRLGSGNVGQTLSLAQFHEGSPTSELSSTTRIIYEKTSTAARLWYDGDGSGTRFSAKLIATFTTEKPDLSITDFLII
ncbi:cadherin domain-containing protein [Microvirga sp. G4-2]|uniref:cadherin domain-containing protein n=1 Tax=Microvirga sp. G4-2 TaxID=3434467 RepID=UPI00404516CD